MKWEDGKPQIIQQCEMYELVPRMSKKLKLNKFHRRILKQLLECGALDYYSLCCHASGIDSCDKVDAQRWRRVSKALAYLWAHAMVRTRQGNVAQLTVEGWIIAMELRNDERVQQVRAADVADADG